jgi:hypothetical protein
LLDAGVAVAGLDPCLPVYAAIVTMAAALMIGEFARPVISPASILTTA